MRRKYTKRGRKYSRKRHLGRKKMGRKKSMRFQKGGNPAFVGAPWDGSSPQTWGSSNYYALSPEGSGSGDPLNLLLGTRQMSPNMMGGRKSRRKSKKSKSKRKSKKNKKNKKTRRMQKGGFGYKGDMMFQNGVNMVRSVGTGLGDVIKGFEGYPKGMSPMPVDQPAMDKTDMPISMPADVDSLYKSAQDQVGSI
tara:strand:+ start:5169 stop:5750 length:582 start_codon:yes stop_codon:yes gene_type:complete